MALEIRFGEQHGGTRRNHTCKRLAGDEADSFPFVHARGLECDYPESSLAFDVLMALIGGQRLLPLGRMVGCNHAKTGRLEHLDYLGHGEPHAVPGIGSALVELSERI